MGFFGLLNYEDYILRALITSSYARSNLIIAVLYCITSIVRFHLGIIINTSLIRNNSLDLITPIITAVLLSMISDTLFKYVETHRPFYESVVDYFMQNYSKRNFVRWKRYCLFIICCYILITLLLVTITNQSIFIATVQTTIAFCICDFIEHKLSPRWYKRLINHIAIPINNWLYRPIIRTHSLTATIIADYNPELKVSDQEVLKSVIPYEKAIIPYEKVVPIPIKPPTPPTTRK